MSSDEALELEGEIKKVWDIADQNGDGSIDAKELSGVAATGQESAFLPLVLPPFPLVCAWLRSLSWPTPLRFSDFMRIVYVPLSCLCAFVGPCARPRRLDVLVHLLNFLWSPLLSPFPWLTLCRPGMNADQVPSGQPTCHSMRVCPVNHTLMES
jgi:hypothetical protein